MSISISPNAFLLLTPKLWGWSYNKLRFNNRYLIFPMDLLLMLTSSYPPYHSSTPSLASDLDVISLPQLRLPYFCRNPTQIHSICLLLHIYDIAYRPASFRTCNTTSLGVIAWLDHFIFIQIAKTNFATRRKESIICIEKCVEPWTWMCLVTVSITRIKWKGKFSTLQTSLFGSG